MSHQGEDGWYPECEECGCGNLMNSITLCKDCIAKVIDKWHSEECGGEMRDEIKTLKYRLYIESGEG